MLHSLQSLLEPALAERLTLLLNHVLASEPAATDRLRPHAGRSAALTLSGWPSLLPPPPRLAWQITPAGLLEWAGAGGSGAARDLAVSVDASNPAALVARALAGQTPSVQIEGDARLAGDVDWLIQNLRWDVAADLERLFGPSVGSQLHRIGSALAAGWRRALRSAVELGERLRPRGP